MELVRREEILDYETYEDQRIEIRERVMKIKQPRRISIGNTLTFLFENKETIRYQIQEMIRVERIVREEDIQHEIDTYNEILGKTGELGCTLLIEIDDPSERDKLLTEWIDLPKNLFLKLEDETKVKADFDHRQIGENRLSSVQYIKFNTEGKIPVAIGSDHKLFTAENLLSEDQKNALKDDLN